MSHLAYPAPHDTWHSLAKPVSGHIQGLPTYGGRAIATNYVHVAIEQGDGRIVFGHLQWFVKDKPDEPTELDDFKVSKAKDIASVILFD